MEGSKRERKEDEAEMEGKKKMREKWERRYKVSTPMRVFSFSGRNGEWNFKTLLLHELDGAPLKIPGRLLKKPLFGK